MWRPVLDGKAYLQELAAEHRKLLVTMYGVVPDGAGTTSEILGFPISHTLSNELKALRLATLLDGRTPCSLIVCEARGDMATEQLICRLDSQGRSCEVVTLSDVDVHKGDPFRIPMPDTSLNLLVDWTVQRMAGHGR